MSVGIVLVHGYTGTQNDLMFLSKKLSFYHGSDSVINTSLKFHNSDQMPDFEQNAFEQIVIKAIKSFMVKKKKLVLIGHSTGGTLILSCMLKYSIKPDLLVLAGVPNQIDVGYLSRWEKHSAGKRQPNFSAIAKMISLINSTGKTKFNGVFPVLIMHGEKDDLVLNEEASKWYENFEGEKRIFIIQDSGHHFFKDIEKNDLPTDIILRAISDLKNSMEKELYTILEPLIRVEPEIKPFLEKSPLSGYHLSQCPSGQKVMGKKPDFPEIINTEPVLANIEITTHCNLLCRFCARTKFEIKGINMPVEMFSRIIQMLPHAYRINLVGLGEPLLHPDIINLVEIAVSFKRRISLVTNATNLDRSMSEKLLNAGLDSIVFSIDGPDQKISRVLRYGTNFKKTIEHIKMFTMLTEKSGKQISMAVFSAVSLMSIDYLKKLIDIVSGLGVNVLMLSDLNFKHNLDQGLWKNMDDRKASVIRNAIKYSFAKKLPILSVHGLEEFGLKNRYMEFLATPPSKIYGRSKTHTHCLSPWQTIPVSVTGDVSVCDCQPEKIVGNLFSDSFDRIWNGKIFKEHRQKMTGVAPPYSCRICPRF